MGEHYVVKYGEFAEEVEAAAMMFLRNVTSVNLPKVYAVYHLGGNGVIVIVMEFIPGENLLTIWPQLSTARKEQICFELKRQIDQLRNLPSLGYFGGVGKQHMPDGIFWTGEGDNHNPHVNGPFQSESELNEALVRKTLLIDQTWNDRSSERAQFYQRMLPSVLRDHDPTFTHADLQRKNIIIQSRSGRDVAAVLEDSNDKLEVEEFVVVLVDWEKSGWYPSYWEYCAASWAFRFDDDWPECVEKFLKPWPIEYAWIHILRNELWS